MTDQEKLQELLLGFGIPYTSESSSLGNLIRIEVTSANKAMEKVVGYSGFATEFVFNSDGTFKHIGIWE